MSRFATYKFGLPLSSLVLLSVFLQGCATAPPPPPPAYGPPPDASAQIEDLARVAAGHVARALPTLVDDDPVGGAVVLNVRGPAADVAFQRALLARPELGAKFHILGAGAPDAQEDLRQLPVRPEPLPRITGERDPVRPNAYHPDLAYTIDVGCEIAGGQGQRTYTLDVRITHPRSRRLVYSQQFRRNWLLSEASLQWEMRWPAPVQSNP